MADQKWEIFGPNGQRTTDDPGNATVVEGGNGESRTPFNWGDLAYTAGGGALGYMLSKWIMGDDDDDDRKKKGGFLKSIVPWLAAAAGAYGGHVLSGAGLGIPGFDVGDKGQNGEFAFKRNEDGTIQIPEKPISGKIPNKAGNILLGTGGATAAGAAVGRAAKRPSSLLEKVRRAGDAVDAEKIRQRIYGTSKNPDSVAKLNALEENLAKINEKYVKSYARSQRPLGKVVGAVGSKWNRMLGSKGGFASAGLQLGAGTLGRIVGHILNERRRNINKGVEYAGGR